MCPPASLRDNQAIRADTQVGPYGVIPSARIPPR